MGKRNFRYKKKKPANTKPATPQEIRSYREQILRTLRRAGGNLSEKVLFQRCQRRRCMDGFNKAMEMLIGAGKVYRTDNGFAAVDESRCFEAETQRIIRSFGFIRDDEGQDYFIPGKKMKGSMPGDRVLAMHIPSCGEEPEAEILSIIKENPDCRLTGIAVRENGQYKFLPDSRGAGPMALDPGDVLFREGDKLLARLVSRGERHRDHKVCALLNFGTCQRAENCIAAHIADQDIPVDFPLEVLKQAEKAQLSEMEYKGREDLRDVCIFTIDGAHSKDLDDAVSVEKTENGWILGVHIADVSHYVKQGSLLDGEAFLRGTSIYYGDHVIPMLPPALSNGICSLNGGEDRLAFSAFMEVSSQGDLLRGDFRKSVIRSRVRGVYEECNRILDGTASEDLLKKYAPVKESLKELDALAGVLENRRKQRGAPSLESIEAEPILNEEGICVGMAPVQRGRSEEIIESCMLCANEAAARLAREKKLPLVYRVHEEPNPEKLGALGEILEKLGAQRPKFSEKPGPGEIQQLLDAFREQPYFPLVNSMTLRSMAKARYSQEALGHFGLALRDYAHFTSPIRRYADLAVHRILSAYLAGEKETAGKFSHFAENAAQRASDTEQRAVSLERTAAACYGAEYMQGRIGDTFDGIISGVTEHGLYVLTDQLVEMFMPIEELPPGGYEAEAGWRIAGDGIRLTMGDRIRVLCTSSDINSGRVMCRIV